MASFAQTSGGDLLLIEGRLVLVTGAEEKAQKIRNRLRLFQGEWFLDTRVGMPWFTYVLGVKAPDLDVIRNLIQRAILSVPGIADVQDLTLTWDRETRELSYEFRAIDDEGTVIDGASDEPFIVEG